MLIDNNIIEQVKFTKFLGVLINENLNWSDHMKLLLNKTNKNLGVIRRLCKTLPLDILLILYTTVMAPYFEYCNMGLGIKQHSHI